MEERRQGPSVLSVAFSITSLAVIVVGVSRTLLLLGILDGGDSDGSDGSESEEGGASGGEERRARRRLRRSALSTRSGSGGGSAPRAATEAADEGELFPRRAASSWLEGSGAGTEQWREATGNWDASVVEELFEDDD